MSLQSIGQQPSIYSELREKLPNPQTPWATSRVLFDRITKQPTPVHQRFKKCALLPSDPEYEFVRRYFLEHKPTGYGIDRVHCIHNRNHIQAFESELTNIESEANYFLPRWSEGPDREQREEVIERWKSSVQSFTPLEISTADGKERLFAVKVLPLFHGSSPEKCESIANSGFVYFGKHPSLDPQTSTDKGFFGSGIYFTNSAEYAAMYAKGNLLLSWVSMREPYPVVSDQVFPAKPTDMKILEGKGAYQNYNAHYIPVASVAPDSPECKIYYPTVVDQIADCDEVVVFQKSQTLPRFWIELAPDSPRTLPTAPDLEKTYAICLAIQTWIEEDPNRLKETNAQGLTLMHMAAATGQSEVVRWLHAQNPHLIKQANHQKWTPLHLAAFHEQLDVLSLFIEQAKELIFLIAEKPCPRTLDFLLKQGVSPRAANPFQQTLLHLAAQAGQEQNVTCLIKQGANPNDRDHSKRTPLFLAVLQNHRSIVQLLLTQTNVTFTSIEEETLLHAAAFYGHTPLLQDLLHYPPCRGLIEAKDHDGKTPLHKAVWMDPKPDIVKLLIAHGANPRAVNTYGYTPLHWAAKHGHLKSIHILMEQKVDVHALNKNGDSPLDLALRFEQDEVVHFFLGTTRRLKTEPPTQDLEVHYCKRLKEAKQENLLEEQIFFLVKLSDVRIEKKDFVTGAKLLNSAFALLKNNPLFEKYLLTKLERIERLFLESEGIKTTARGSISTYRRQLNENRKQCIAAFARKEPIQTILANQTTASIQLFQSLIEDAQQTLGPPPVRWACMGMGSMSRSEMCPYSDIEFAFLIAQDKPEALTYFDLLSKLLQLQIINLGETEYSVFDKKEPSPTPKGFSLDNGGNTPLGTDELIGTPKQLARFQTLKWIDENIILANASNSVCLVAGEHTLVDTYIHEKTAIQRPKQGWFDYWNNKQPEILAETLALRLLADHIREFAPDLSQTKEQMNAFGIKKELYRPFQENLNVLALFYQLKATNTFERIDELVDRDVFSAQGAENLKQALRKVLTLRLEAQLFYREELEILCHPEEGKPPEPQLFYLDQSQIESLHAIYQVLIPFHKSMKKFYTIKNKQTLNSQPFHDKRPIVRAEALEKMLQYQKAHIAYQEAISLDPNDIEVLLSLGSMEKTLGNAEEELKRAKKVLALAKNMYSEEHPTVAIGYHNIGIALTAQGQYAETLEYYQKALEIRLRVFGERHSSVAESYNCIGVTFDFQGRYAEAFDFFQKALMIQLKVFGEEHSHVAGSYNNIGIVMDAQGQYAKAFDSHQKALMIRQKVLGEGHPEVGASYAHIGSVLHTLGKYDEALEHLQKSLNIKQKVLGKEHPDVAAKYTLIGSVLQAQGQYAKALEHFQKSLEIQLKVLGEEHFHVAASYTNFGSLLYAQGQYAKALEYFQKALNIHKVLDEKHPGMAVCYNNIGSALNAQGQYAKALECFQKALNINLKVLDENHPGMAVCYLNIGSVFDGQGQYAKALEYFQKSLKIQRKALGERHPDVVASYSNIGRLLIRAMNKRLSIDEKS
ncbi:MAG: tetratricopeptide repeat protein [Rhabdochlamydiaceae bacterium]